MTQPINGSRSSLISHEPENLNKALLDLARYLQNKGVVIQDKLPFGVSIQLYQLLNSYFADPLVRELWLGQHSSSSVEKD